MRNIFTSFRNTVSPAPSAPSDKPSRPHWRLRLRRARYLWDLLQPREQWTVRGAGTLLAVGLVILLWQGYRDLTVPKPAPGGNLTEATIGSPQYLNPLYAKTNDVDLDLTRLIFSGLVQRDANQEIKPDLAESYERSADEKTYTFRLRHDVRWHNGSSFSADDVIYTIQMIQDPAFRSPLVDTLAGVTAEKIDDFTVTLTLQEPFAPFLESLTFGILPAEQWSSITPGNARLTVLNIKPIGTGPYRISSKSAFTKDGDGNIISYRLERNPDYYGDKALLDAVEFKFYTDFEQAAAALRDGKVDSMSFVPKTIAATLANNRQLQLYTLHLPQYTALFFNQNHNELLKQSAVREALAYALDREKIISDGYRGQASVIDSPILPDYLGYNPEVKKRAYDTTQAAKLLDDAGWKYTDGEEARKNKDGKLLEITLTTVDDKENMSVAEQVRQMWEQMHVKVNLQVVPATQIAGETIKPRNYDVLLYGQIIGSDPDPYPFWHSSQNKAPGVNLAIFSNKLVDQLLVEARKTSDPEQRRLKYLHFQNLIADDVPAIFLYNPTYSYALATKIKGFTQTRLTSPADRFADVTHWYSKEKREWK